MWIELTPETLARRLTDAETNALKNAGTSSADVLAEIAADVASEWRGAVARHCVLDTRPDAVPSELLSHILAVYRYRAFTRLPGMKGLLDPLRVAEWERANHIFDNLKSIYIAPPEAPNAPEANTPTGQARPVFGPAKNTLATDIPL